MRFLGESGRRFCGLGDELLLKECVLVFVPSARKVLALDYGVQFSHVDTMG